ncbi:MAG: ion transporter [Luteimonas sp.]
MREPRSIDPSGLRGRVHACIVHPRVQALILTLILVNAVLLGMETSPRIMAAAGAAIRFADTVILAVFVIEIALRLFVDRGRFFRDPWSLFDFCVVAIALVPASGPFAVLRALRVLRVLRVLTVVPSMRRVVGALLGAVPGLLSIGAVLAIIYYVCAVIATNLFGSAYPEWFGNIGRSLYTLFQIMTLDSWSSGMSRPIMETFPYAWAFFIPFILVASFTMLNLFIGVIVDAMQTVSKFEHADTRDALDRTQAHIEADLHTEVRALRGEIRDLRHLMASGTPK